MAFASTKILGVSLLLIGVVAAVGAVFFVNQTPAVYSLTVVNFSPSAVNSLRLFGTACEIDAQVKHIGPGERKTLNVRLRREGVLRFDISQGLNRIDTTLMDDIAMLEVDQQWLAVHPGNRFIITDTDPQP